MSGQPCPICHQWVQDIIRHNVAHLKENPHTFCRTIRCDNGDDCPVAPPEIVRAIARVNGLSEEQARPIANGLVRKH